MEDALHLYRSLVDMGSKPALTWYSSQGRMELSGTVIANHLAKISSFLAEDAWTECGEIALLDLPCHWKSLLWALGSMLAGLHLDVYDDDEDKDKEIAVFITNHPEAQHRENIREIVALDMKALTFGWTGSPLPEGVLDGSAGQLSHPDVLTNTERHRSSNFSQWVQGTLPHEERALVATNSLTEAIRCACIQFSRGSSLVIAPQANLVPEAEGAHRVALSTR